MTSVAPSFSRIFGSVLLPAGIADEAGLEEDAVVRAIERILGRRAELAAFDDVAGPRGAAGVVTAVSPGNHVCIMTASAS